MPRRRIDDTKGRQALTAAATELQHLLSGDDTQTGAGGVLTKLGEISPAQLDAALDRPTLLTAARWALEELAERAPGRAVEVRVPPAGAVQILGGTVHRRGTPPAVIEMSMSVWVLLAAGQLSWDEAEGAALLQASGERATLRDLLPLL
ncbi:sterol carrier family protein [Boudabousia marimammalium]|uniref:Bacterial SCP orthologue domain-containing protein n=1 Tax=Boudabousia marimammalium TaxID=156892 RepID=A0A1Q5PJY2_9ACTO|nr:sterol carrier family protein [Boudabousia marimammalium]OKL46251.1 hypothetical protein BM477_07430 [Boudabousia marimammalium]